MNTMCITVNMRKIKAKDMRIADTAEFGIALSFYMSEVNITVNELAELSKVPERTIWRYRDNKQKHFDIKAVAALCIGLHLSAERSKHLINLAGLSLKPTDEHSLYMNFLGYAYCSDITVEKCNDILIENGFEALTI